MFRSYFTRSYIALQKSFGLNLKRRQGNNITEKEKQLNLIVSAI